MNARLNTPPALNVEPNIADHDAFYEMLVDTHQDLDEAQSGMLNAQLILLLSNHIGDLDVLRAACALARRNVGPAQPT